MGFDGLPEAVPSELWSRYQTQSWPPLSLCPFDPILLTSRARLRYVKSLPTKMLSSHSVKIKTTKNHKKRVRKAQTCLFSQVTKIPKEPNYF